MSNLDYWKKFAGLVRFRQDMKMQDIPVDLLGSYVRDYLAKGLAFLICQDHRKARAYLEQSESLLLKKLDLYPEADDDIYLFVIGWIREGRLDLERANRGILFCCHRLGRWIIKRGQLDLFRMYQKMDLPEAPEAPDDKTLRDSFIPMTNLMYPYMECALFILEISRRCLMTGDFLRGVTGSGIAKDLCRMAVQKIPRTMTLIDRRWESVEQNIIDFSSFTPETRNEYIRLREKLSAPIPPMVREADLVNLIGQSAQSQLQGIRGIDEHSSWLFKSPEAFFQEIKGSFLTNPGGGRLIEANSELPLGRMVSDFFNRIRETLASHQQGRPLGVLRDFFDDYISSPGMMKSPLGLLHCLEWVLIRSRLEMINNLRLEVKPESFIREYLG